MEQRQIQNLKRLFLISIPICLLLIIWQGIDSLFSDMDRLQNTMTRILVFNTLFLGTTCYCLYIWAYTQKKKTEAVVELAENALELAENMCKEEVQKMQAMVAQKLEEVGFWGNQAQRKVDFEGQITLPCDYSFDRDRIVFVKQKGANGQTAYQYAYYEVVNNELIIGKANLNKTLYSSQSKTDGLNRLVGEVDAFAVSDLVVYKQATIDLNSVPKQYKQAIQLGVIKTETILSLLKQWTGEYN